MLFLIVIREDPSEKVTVEQRPKAMWISRRAIQVREHAVSECGSYFLIVCFLCKRSTRLTS